MQVIAFFYYCHINYSEAQLVIDLVDLNALKVSTLYIASNVQQTNFNNYLRK